MKKLFTLITLFCAALGMQAQGKFALDDTYTVIAAGSNYTTVPNITLTIGVEGENDYEAPSADLHVEGYTHYTKGNGVMPTRLSM